MDSEKKTSFINFLSFITLIIIAILIFISRLLPVVGVEIKGTTPKILSTLGYVLGLLVIGLSSRKYVHGRKIAKILYSIAILIFIAGIVLVWLGK